MGGVLEHLVLPIHIRIDQRVAAVAELLELGIGIGRCGTVVQAGAVQGVSIVVGTHHVGRLRVELELVRETCLEVIFSVFIAVLGLHQEHTIDGLVSVEGHSGGVLQNGNTFNLLNRKAVERAFYTVDKDEDVTLTGGLHATNVECCTTAFLALETSVLEGVQAQ